jgi:alpha-L-fucosidase
VTARADRGGRVTLALDQPGFHGKGAGFRTQGLTIRYTLDGSDPDRDSAIYQEPVALPRGGELRVRSFSSAGEGPVGVFRFGPAKAGWKAVASSEESDIHGASKAIDGDPATFWHSRWSEPAPGHPHRLEVDLGGRFRLAGISYLPRQDRRVPDSMIERGRIEVSLDGRSWEAAGDFEFGNLLNDPGERRFRFPEAREARCVRLVSTSGVEGKPYAGAAEFGVMLE